MRLEPQRADLLTQVDRREPLRRSCAVYDKHVHHEPPRQVYRARTAPDQECDS